MVRGLYEDRFRPCIFSLTRLTHYTELMAGVKVAWLKIKRFRWI